VDQLKYGEEKDGECYLADCQRTYDDVYDEPYFTMRLKPDWISGAEGIAKGILDVLHPKSVVDCGCALGTEIAYLERHGVKVKGLDGGSWAIKHRQTDKVEQWDLRVPYPWKQKWDVCTCFETIEHINAKFEDVLLTNLTNASDVVAISVPYQVGGRHHMNEQPPEHWVDKFKQLGYEYDGSTTERLKRAMRGGKGWVVGRLQLFRKRKS